MSSRRDPVRLATLSPLRLLGLLALFVIACLMAVLRSDRFSRESRRLIIDAASASMGRRVRFEGLSFSIIPPSLSIRGVEISGGAGETEPFFRAAEISVAEDIHLVGRTLTLGSISVVRPVIHLVVGRDGRDNLPPGLKRRASGSALHVHIGRLSIISGIFKFNDIRVPLDLEADALVAEMASSGSGAIVGRIGCRQTHLSLGPGTRLDFSFEARLGLDKNRLHIDGARLRGEFGDLSASGDIADLSRPVVSATASGELDIEAVERDLATDLPFRGHVFVTSVLRLGGPDKFRVAGTIEGHRITASGFRFDDLVARAVASPSGVDGFIEKASFEGGTIGGVVRLGAFDAPPEAIRLLLSGESLGLDGFFADIGLPATGLASRGNLSLALGWRGGGPDHADGGGEIEFLPDATIRPGGVPLSGSSRFAIADGTIRFEDAALEMPSGSIRFAGGIPIGRWTPDLRFQIDSRDFRAVDRLARNFEAAISGRPAAGFGLGGSGSIEGTLTQSWSLPSIEAKLSAENLVYSGIRLGTAYADISVADGAFIFHRFRSYDGEAGLTLDGSVRYIDRRNVPRFDLSVSVNGFPSERILRYLDFDLPITGAITGNLSLAGNPDSLAGRGDFQMSGATIYGQRIDSLVARAVLSPGRLAFEDIRAAIAGGSAAGTISFDITRRRYGVRLKAENLDLAGIGALHGFASEIGGRASIEAEGEGDLEHPALTIDVATSAMSIGGRRLATNLDPKLSIQLTPGKFDLEASAGDGAGLTASGDLSEPTGHARYAIHVDDLAPFFAAAGIGATGISGAVAADGSLTIRASDMSIQDADATIRKLKLVEPGPGGELEARAESRVAYSGGVISVLPLRLEGGATSLDLSARLDVGSRHFLDGSIRGTLDPALIFRLDDPAAEAGGRISIDLGLAGPIDRPAFTGSLVLADGRLRMPDSLYSFDGVAARLTLDRNIVSLDAFHAKVGGGEIAATGDARLDGLDWRQYRLVIQAQNVGSTILDDLRLRSNAELTIVGTPEVSDIRGEVRLVSGSYTRDFAPTLANILSRSRPQIAPEAPAWQKSLRLDVHVVSLASLEIRNNVARLSASVDLLARGTLADPILLGQVAVEEGGRITFQDVTYLIDSATITFGNSQKTEPIVDVNASADIRGYTIGVQAAGFIGERSRVQFHFTSDPPLSDEQIASLLLAGVTPESSAASRTASSSTSSVVGSLAGLAFTPVTSQVQQLFRLDRFQVDPILQSSTGTGGGGAVITVGKNLTKDISVRYSYSAEANSQSILLVDYQVDANTLIEASKDENDIYSISIKFRKRL